MYVGPIGDFGYSYHTIKGFWRSEKFGDKVETAYLESVPEGPTRSARWSAWPVTAAISSSPPRSASWTPSNKVAKRFPEVKFEHATGFKQESENVALYNARFYEGRYIIGQIAPSSRRPGSPATSCRSRSRSDHGHQRLHARAQTVNPTSR
jgi:simple sugar transport system substrate-binding protein